MSLGQHATSEFDAKVQSHLIEMCREAGLGSMIEVIGIIRDRENVSDARLLKMTADDITELYESFIAPGIDRVENLLLECKCGERIQSENAAMCDDCLGLDCPCGDCEAHGEE